MLKQKLTDPKKPESDLQFQITQRDGTIKALKKEVLTLKSTLAKNKAKILEMKKSAPQEIVKKNADLQTQCQDFSNLIEKVH